MCINQGSTDPSVLPINPKIRTFGLDDVAEVVVVKADIS